MDAASTAPAAPESIGPFRIVRVLGYGAMGVVYLGERIEMFSQRVAIKLLRPQVSLLSGEDPLLHEQFILTSLDHPAIVRLLDSGVLANGARYLCMEYVDGLQLEQYCGERRPTQEQALTLLIQILDAVDYAHRHLVLHGDLKPENILVMANGHAKLLDFGVAALLQVSGQAAESSFHTPAFASPEQRAGGRLTAAGDIYSLGVIARLMLTGKTGTEDSGSNRDLLAILGKATRPEGDRRYCTVREFADDLRALLAHRPIAARRGNRTYVLGRWIRRHRTAAAMAGLVAIILTGSVIGVSIQTARAAHQRRVAEERLYDLVRLTGSLEGELYDSVHPLAQGEGARTSLLQAAAKSLDRLASQEGGDPAMAIELAHQYRRLALLERSNGGMDSAAGMDLAKGRALVRAVPSSSSRYPAAQAEMAELGKIHVP